MYEKFRTELTREPSDHFLKIDIAYTGKYIYSFGNMEEIFNSKPLSALH